MIFFAINGDHSSNADLADACGRNNKRVRPLRGRPLWDRPCSWVRACCFGAF